MGDLQGSGIEGHWNQRRIDPIRPLMGKHYIKHRLKKLLP